MSNPTPQELSSLLLDSIQDPKIGAVKNTFCVGQYQPRVSTRTVQVDLHLQETPWLTYGKFAISRMDSEWGEIYFLIENCSFTRETFEQHMLQQTLVGEILDAAQTSIRAFKKS